MERTRLSVTQFMILLWGSLFSPVMELLLSMVSGSTPKGGFLTPLFALPFLLLGGYVFSSLGGSEKKVGFHHGLTGSIPSSMGLFLLLTYLLWGIFVLSLRLQLSALSFRTVGYKEGSFFFLLPVLALFIWWMAGTGLSSFARSATFFFGALVLMFSLVMGLSASQVKFIYLLPVTVSDIPSLLEGTTGVLSVLGYLMFATFFLGDVSWGDNASNHRTWVLWCVLVCVAMSLFLFVATGVFGASLLQDMGDPFLQLAKGVRVEGGFQRIESLVAAIWTLGDFLLLGVILRSCVCLASEILRHVGKKIKNETLWERLVLGVIVGISAIIALFFPYLHRLSETVVLFGSLLLGWVLPFGIFLTKKVLHSKGNCDRLESV